MFKLCVNVFVLLLLILGFSVVLPVKLRLSTLAPSLCVVVSVCNSTLPFISISGGLMAPFGLTVMKHFLLPKFHREIIHDDFFSIHIDLCGSYWVLCNTNPNSVYLGPFDCLSNVKEIMYDANQRMRWIKEKGVI